MSRTPPMDAKPAAVTLDGTNDCTMVVAATTREGQPDNGCDGLDETTPLTANQESFSLGKFKCSTGHHDTTVATTAATYHVGVAPSIKKRPCANEPRAQRPTFVETLMDTVRPQPFSRFHNPDQCDGSDREHRLNILLSLLLLLTTLLLLLGAGYYGYHEIVAPFRARKAYETAVKAHAMEAAKLVEQCRGIDWRTACERLGAAGARRRSRTRRLSPKTATVPDTDEYETFLLHSDDPTITYDQFCLRVHRMKLYGDITFPYHSSQLLQSGGNQTMALFIQHGALRNAEEYFCSFKELMEKQHYRPFEEILIIAPNFQYETDFMVHPNDAFWNSSKPWGDWRVGAESDPSCCGRSGRTISSFDVLDNMLAMLTSKRLFPRMNKIAYVGHSAGGQMVQRYSMMSDLATLWAYDDEVDIDFIIANPSSYAYLDGQRFRYTCGDCQCDSDSCNCTEACTAPHHMTLGRPTSQNVGTHFPCYQWNYNRWPYGLGSFSDDKGRSIPYAMRGGVLRAERALRSYKKLHVTYMVGQNDTCNDGLPTCDVSCWKRDSFLPEEWPCFPNSMDRRCPAMLQGPCRRTRGYQYMKYLETLYGEPVHTLREIPGVGHNASGMFGSEIGMQELFM